MNTKLGVHEQLQLMQRYLNVVAGVISMFYGLAELQGISGISDATAKRF